MSDTDAVSGSVSGELFLLFCTRCGQTWEDNDPACPQCDEVEMATATYVKISCAECRSTLVTVPMLGDQDFKCLCDRTIHVEFL